MGRIKKGSVGMPKTHKKVSVDRNSLSETKKRVRAFFQRALAWAERERFILGCLWQQEIYERKIKEEQKKLASIMRKHRRVEASFHDMLVTLPWDGERGYTKKVHMAKIEAFLLYKTSEMTVMKQEFYVCLLEKLMWRKRTSYLVERPNNQPIMPLPRLLLHCQKMHRTLQDANIL